MPILVHVDTKVCWRDALPILQSRLFGLFLSEGEKVLHQAPSKEGARGRQITVVRGIRKAVQPSRTSLTPAGAASEAFTTAAAWKGGARAAGWILARVTTPAVAASTLSILPTRSMKATVTVGNHGP